MTELLGKSVGEWSDNKNINFDNNFSNVSGSFFSSSYLNGNPRTIRFKLGNKEFAKRKTLYVKLTREMGLKEPLINSFWSKWLIKGNTNSDGFEKFIKDQLLLQEAKEKEEEKLIEKLREEEKKKVISDLNLFPPKDKDTTVTKDKTTVTKDKTTVTEDKTTVKQTLIGEKQTDKKPNYLLFGLIGLGVIIGGFLIFKKK